ncbi:MAG: type II secretion system F family protein [Candidatus Eremiobacteraeota bacterium]|nr:type II secretion system F family protein [Candidatus Eremiobacteraeota bacterium]
MQPEQAPQLDRESLRDFLTQLSVLVGAGLSLQDGLDLLARADEPFSPLALALLKRFQQGYSLAAAFSAFPQEFDRWSLGYLRLAERTGSLVPAFEQLARRAQEYDRRQRQLRAALSYPIGVALVSTLICSLLVWLFLPRILEVVTGFGVTPPWPTRLLMLLYQGRFALVGLGLAPVLAVLMWARLDPTSFARAREQVLDRLPQIGDLLRCDALARICKDLSLATQAGVPLVDALDMVAGSCGHRHLGNSLAASAHGLREGHELADCLDDFVPLFSQAMIVGQESGRLPRLLLAGAAILEEEIGLRSQRLIALVEPAMMLFLGGGVGLVVLACLLPIYQVIALG